MGWQDIYKKKMQAAGLESDIRGTEDVKVFYKAPQENYGDWRDTFLKNMDHAGLSGTVRLGRESSTQPSQTVSASPAKEEEKKKKYVASPYGTFLGGFSYNGNTRRQKTEQELADEAAQQAAYIKEYQRLAGIDLDSYGKQVESAKKAAQDNRTMYNVRAFGGYDASRMTDEERTYAAMQADYNKAKDIQYDIKGQAALENLTAEQSKAVETLASTKAVPAAAAHVEDAKRASAWDSLLASGFSEDEIRQLVNYQRNIPKRQKNAELYAEIQEAAESYAETNPVLATIASVPANLLSGIGTIDAVMRKMSDPDSPVDYKSGAFLPYAYASGVRGEVTKNLQYDHGDVAAFAYGVGTSMMDSAATLGLAALGIPAGVASATLGGAAATSAMMEAKARGLSDEKAIRTGVLAGVAETALEKFSLDRLISMKLPTGTAKQRVVGALKNAAVQAGIEGSEEMFTDFANLIFDSAVNGSMSDVQQRIAVYMAGGMDYDEARKKVLGETVKDVALDFVAGGLAGGLMGGGSMALQTAAQGAYDARVNDARTAVRQRAGVTGSYQAAEDGKTSYNGQETSVRSVVKDGKVELTTGETVDPKDVQFSDRNTADLYEGAIRTAENAGAAQVFVDSYTGGDVSTYILGMQEAYHNGKEGVPLEDAGGFAADLSDAQRRAAWEQGRAAASVPDLKDYGFGEKGTQAWNKVQENEAVRNNRRLRAGFTAMYQAGMRGESASAVKSDAAKYIPPSVQTAAYQAGLADAAESLARETAAVQFVSSAGSESGLVDNEYSRKLAKEKPGTAALLSMLGKDLGVRVEIVPKVLGGNANGQYVAGRNLIQIAADADNAFEFVAAHEVTHRMQSLAPEEYRSYRDYAMRFRAQELGEEGAVALVERYRSMSEEAGVTLTQEEAMDEIAADLTMRMIEDGGLFEDFARENRSEAGKLLDALKAFIQKVKSLFRGKEARDNAAREAYGTDMATLEECVARWQKAYTAAGKSAQNAKTAAGEGSGDGLLDIEKKKVISAASFSAETHSEVLPPKPSTNSISTSDGNVNAKFSLKGMDSAGRQLSEQQQEYFKDSKVRDAEGLLMPLYHQTDAEFTVFDTRHKGAGTGDNETPFGVFLKKSSKDIGVKGNRQMELYANIKNPLQVRDRSELVFHLARMSPEYEALKAKSDVVDKEYGRKFEKAKKDFVDFIAEWRRQNPNASRSALYEVDEFNRVFDAEDNIVEEWGKVKDELALQAKETITAALRNNGYDGVIISEDSGSFGRTTDAYIALDANQVKRTDNLNPTSDPDIRFQLKSARELEQEVKELKKYAAYRKRGTSDREILTSTADSSAQTEWERKRLAEYKDVMGRLETYERRLSENKAKLEELAFLGDKKNARRISQLKTEITQDTNRIGIVENKLGELENTSSLKTLLDREKAIIHQQEGEYLRKVEELMGGYRDLYGTMAKGEKAARDIQMPKKTSENEKISQTVRTILEAKATPDEMVPTIEEMALNGEYSYEVYSDKNAISDAEEEIKRVGWAQSLSEWTKAVQKGEVSKKNTAMGWALYNNAANSGDTGTALTILSNMVEHQRSAAQALQATRILKSLSPETQLYQAQRSVDNLQTEMNKRYGDKKAPELKIDPALAEQFMQATDQETRDAVLRNIYRDIGKQMPSRFGDKWNAWRYLAMLGNARTHVRNVVGNAGFAPVVAAKNAVATGIEKAVYRLSDGKMERSKEFVFGKDGKALLKAAAQDYAKVQDVAMGGGKYSDLANANKYIEEGRVIFQSKVPVLKQVSKGLEAARKANSKALDAEDVWFSKPHYAYAMAQYCKANGITPQMIEAGKGIEKAREYAIREAQKATYRDTNSFSQAISELGRTVKPGSNGTRKAVAVAMEGILPFRKTPANILVRGVEYSPIGLMNGIKQALFDVRKGTKTAAEAIDSISAGLTGTGLLGLGLFLAAQGLVRGHGSDDDDKNAYAELTGHQAYALELPDGTSITLDWLAPECLPFFIGVNLWEITDGGKEILTMSDALNAVTMVSEPLLEMSCLQSLNDVFDAVGYASSNGLSALPAALANAATSYMTQALPTILGQAERAGENIRYATYTDKNSALTSDMQYALGRASAKIPGLDYSQIPYIDAWGRRESTGNLGKRLLNNFLNPAYVSDVSESEMEKELLRLYEATGESGVLPSRAGKSFSANNEKLNLTGEQYVKYAEKRGGEAYKWMTALTQSNAYRSMSDEEKADCVKYIYEAANEVAKSGIVGSSYEMKTWVKDAVGGAGVVETAIAKTKYADVSQKAVNAYKEFSGSIGEDVFLKTWDALSDMTGEDYNGDGRNDAYSTVDKKLDYINGLNLTAQQKRALAIANGINEKTVDKRAPW